MTTSSPFATMKLAELQAIAQERGLTEALKLRKGELVKALESDPGAVELANAVQGSATTAAASADSELPSFELLESVLDGVANDSVSSSKADAQTGRRGSRRASTNGPVSSVDEIAASAGIVLPEAGTRSLPNNDNSSNDVNGKRFNHEVDRDAARAAVREELAAGELLVEGTAEGRPNRNRNRNRNNSAARDQADRDTVSDADAKSSGNEQGDKSNAPSNEDRENNQGQDGEGGRRNRYRDRRRRSGGEDAENDVIDDEQLMQIGGILDILDNYAFVRTTGYLPGPTDIYVSLGQVKKYNLRRGDAVVGSIRQPREGEHNSRQKYNALVKVDLINGQSIEEAASRVEFHNLTPLYPQERLRLETVPNRLTSRMIDLVAPIGKGQRTVIVAPPKSGKSVTLQEIANAISENSPESHLMVVLVDERPEDVTDMQRLVKGEVIASTFDRPAEDHTVVAELAIERAKRLVELGHDVVVILDSLSRLVRAYNLLVPSSGRVLAGGLDAAALYPPKKFLGAARNIENGGSLTVIATTAVDTGSVIDEGVIEELLATSNSEIRLSGPLAKKRMFPAIDINSSGTRRDELLLNADEAKITWSLRRAVASLDATAALEAVAGRVKETQSNAEFLLDMAKNMPLTTNGELKPSGNTSMSTGPHSVIDIDAR